MAFTTLRHFKGLTSWDTWSSWDPWSSSWDAHLRVLMIFPRISFIHPTMKRKLLAQSQEFASHSSTSKPIKLLKYKNLVNTKSMRKNLTVNLCKAKNPPSHLRHPSLCHLPSLSPFIHTCPSPILASITVDCCEPFNLVVNKEGETTCYCCCWCRWCSMVVVTDISVMVVYNDSICNISLVVIYKNEEKEPVGLFHARCSTFVDCWVGSRCTVVTK